LPLRLVGRVGIRGSVADSISGDEYSSSLPTEFQVTSLSSGPLRRGDVLRAAQTTDSRGLWDL